MRILNLNHELLYRKDRLTLDIDSKDRMKLISKLEDIGAIDPQKEYDIEIKRHRGKRSLDANAYMWVLADKIASVIRSTSKEVYKKAIQEVGVFHYGYFKDEDAEYAADMWASNGVGWIAVIEPCNMAHHKAIKFYHGSSSYDTKQMSRVIDYLVDEAKDIGGIEVLSPDELARMKSAWRAE